MPRKWARAGLAVLIDALALTVVTAVLGLIYWVVTGANGEYLDIVSNILFLAGAIILTFGAFLAFFNISKTADIRKLLLNPVLLLEGRGLIPAAGADDKDEEQSAGWLLIFLGATLIVFSILTSLDHLI
jgi:hypothetical protein